MKAQLETRKSVKLNWFKQEKVPFIVQKSMEWSYTVNNILYNETNPSVFSQYVFSNLKNQIPETNIILFDSDLPQCYLKTIGSIGDKVSTEKVLDSDLKPVDRIVKVITGEEKITTKPVPPHEMHRFKEIQIHERTDKIWRKITIKNETTKLFKQVQLTFIENKEVRFLESTPAPVSIDAPEYKWKVDIPAESSISIEISLECYNKQTYQIEKEDRTPRTNSPAYQQQMNLNNKME